MTRRHRTPEEKQAAQDRFWAMHDAESDRLRREVAERAAVRTDDERAALGRLAVQIFGRRDGA